MHIAECCSPHAFGKTQALSQRSGVWFAPSLLAGSQCSQKNERSQNGALVTTRCWAASCARKWWVINPKQACAGGEGVTPHAHVIAINHWLCEREGKQQGREQRRVWVRGAMGQLSEVAG